MVPPTRRGLLGAVGLLVATAGCGGDGRRDDTPTPTVAADPERTVETDTDSGDGVPPTLRLQGGEDTPPVRRSPDGRRRRPVDSDDWNLDSWLLDRAATETLRVAPGGREAVQSFLADTDFETETVYVQSMRTSTCHTVTLCSVSWGGDGIETEYGRQLKPYTAACEADTRVYESRLIRIPTEIDDGGSYSTSLRGDACRDVRREQSGEHHAGSGNHTDDGHHGSESGHHTDDRHHDGTESRRTGRETTSRGTTEDR